MPQNNRQSATGNKHTLECAPIGFDIVQWSGILLICAQCYLVQWSGVLLICAQCYGHGWSRSSIVKVQEALAMLKELIFAQRYGRGWSRSSIVEELSQCSTTDWSRHGDDPFGLSLSNFCSDSAPLSVVGWGRSDDVEDKESCVPPTSVELLTDSEAGLQPPVVVCPVECVHVLPEESSDNWVVNQKKLPDQVPFLSSSSEILKSGAIWCALRILLLCSTYPGVLEICQTAMLVPRYLELPGIFGQHFRTGKCWSTISPAAGTLR